MSTVLVVEDSLTEREILTRCLKNAGLIVVSATSCEEAQQKLSSITPPDLIILDVMLPGQSGFEFCRSLKNDPNTKQIPVIISSMKETKVDKTWATMVGANAFIPKPINEEEMVKKVRELLQKA